MLNKALTLLVVLTLSAACGKKPNSSSKHKSSAKSLTNSEKSSEQKRESLMLAIEGGDETLVKILASELKDVNFTYNGQTPLNLAIEMGRLELVQFLKEAGAKPTMLGSDGLNAIHTTIRKGDDSIFAYFLSTGSLTGEENLRQALIFAISEKQEKIAIDLITMSENFSLKGMRHLAMENGLKTLAYFCHGVENHPTINLHFLEKVVNKGYTNYLRYAGRRSNLPQLANGADLLEKALDIADQDQRTKVIELLLALGFSPDGQENDSINPLLKAAKAMDLINARILLNAGANPNIFDGNNRSAIFYATTNLDVAMVDLLLKNKAKTFQIIRSGRRVYFVTACQNLRVDYHNRTNRTYSELVRDFKKIGELLNCN